MTVSMCSVASTVLCLRPAGQAALEMDGGALPAPLAGSVAVTAAAAPAPYPWAGL